MATDVAITESFEADDPQALNVRARTANRLNNICLVFRNILIPFRKQESIIPVLKKERPALKPGAKLWLM
jgi:hypothetical protein